MTLKAPAPGADRYFAFDAAHRFTSPSVPSTAHAASVNYDSLRPRFAENLHFSWHHRSGLHNGNTTGSPVAWMISAEQQLLQGKSRSLRRWEPVMMQLGPVWLQRSNEAKVVQMTQPVAESYKQRKCRNHAGVLVRGVVVLHSLELPRSEARSTAPHQQG